MRATDLALDELLHHELDRGLIQFAGQRVLLLDAVATGILRKYLAENFGPTAARTVLTQYGFAHGWRSAETMKEAIAWADDAEWRAAGIQIHALEGLFHLVPGSGGPLAPGGMTIANSYEAEQHLLHFGRSEVCVCWTICGLLSGYLSRSEGREIYVMEDRCVGRGDAACHIVGRTRAEWGDHGEESDLFRFFEAKRLEEGLEVSLQRVTTSLKAAERKLNHARRALAHVEFEADEPLGLVAKSAPMRQLVDLARRVAKVDAAVLITGESGAGKERIARLIHDESSRAAGPFVAVNCGAIAETLFESELFGHVRGAFTGANQDRPGLFEAANNGTLLLDEIGDLSQGMQVKLLRVLQEREVRRVGENRTRKIDVRVLAATNRDLAADIAAGTFRLDLYYRLKVVQLEVPPLRARRDDILPLARVLLAASAARMKRELTGFSPTVADLLLRYGWPGNVRELDNAMEHAAALARGSRVEPEDLPDEVRRVVAVVLAGDGAVQTLEEVEKAYILAALEVNGGNQTRTAEQLEIGSATLYRKLKKYGRIAGRDTAGE
jgi:two-component system, NtrC family, response regulator HydG